MKIKIYAVSIMGILGFLGAGFFMMKEYNTTKYQSKDYTNFLITQGDASGAMIHRTMMMANKDGIVDMDVVMKTSKAVQNRFQAKNSANAIYFDELGPNYVGGRSRAIIRDNQTGKEAIFYAGSVTGGVFITYNGGEEWFGYSGDLPNLNIGDLGQTADGVLWVGTGPGHDNFGSLVQSSRQSGGFPGDGLFRRKNEDYPVEYERIIGPESDQAWTWINRVMGHPSDANKIYVGTRGGLMISSDAASSAPTFFNGIEISPGIFVNAWISDVALAPMENGDVVIYATSGTTVYKLLDKGGDDISLVETINLPAGQGTPAWAAIDVAPSDPNYVYAAIGATGSSDCTYGVFQSSDAGKTWTNIARGGGPSTLYQSTNCQSSYDNDIAVFPKDPHKIIVGGVSIFDWTESETSPGTGSWKKIALMQVEGAFGGLTDTNWVHADKHRIIILDSALVYVATDGGIFRSLDGGKTWGQNNNGFNAYQCYSVAAAFGSDLDSLGLGITEQVMGGAQDNGTVLIGTNPTQPDRGFDLSSGDGGDCEFSNLANLGFVSSQRGGLRRASFTAGVSSFYGDETSVICGTNSGGSANCGNFVTTFTYWEEAYASVTYDSLQFKSNVVSYDQGDTLSYASNIGDIPMTYILPRDLPAGDSINVPDFAQSKLAMAIDPSGGSSGVFLTREAANLNDVITNWELVADNSSKTYPDQISGSIWKMQFTADGNQLFVGTTSGVLYRIDNLNYGWDSLTLDINSPLSVVTCTRVQAFGQGIISGLSVDPNNPENVVVGFAGYGGGTQKVFKVTNASSATTNGGNGVSIHGDLPSNIPVYSCLISAHSDNTIVVGTEYGIYVTDNGSGPLAEWHQANGIPRVPTYALFQSTKQWLYGENGPKQFENATYRKIYAGTHGRGYWGSTSLVGIDDDDEGEKKVSTRTSTSQLKVYPNPMSETGFIEINLSQSERVNIEIFDLSGKVVTSMNNQMLQGGKNKIQFDASDLRNGTYIISMKLNDEVKVSKFVVMR